MGLLHHRIIWVLIAVTIGLLVLSPGVGVSALLINRASVEISQALVDGVAPTYLPELSGLAGHGTEQSLRLSVIYQCARGNFSTAERLLQRYVEMASSRQVEQMKHWITTWSLQLARRGDKARAEKATRLLFAFGNDAMAYMHLGQLYQDLGHMDKAEAFLNKSLAIRPNADAFMQLGSLYAEEGMELIQTNHQEALHLLDLSSRAFESAIEVDPKVLVYANYRLGDIYWKLNRRQDAVRAYRQAAENGETGHLAFLSWYYLGQIYGAWWNGGLEYDLARSYFEQALDIATTRREEAMSLSGIAATYEAQGQESEALAIYRRALRKAPDYEPAQKAIESLDSE